MNKAYLEKVLSAPHTLNPDKAQQAGKKPIVEAVGEKKVLTDGTHVVELHHLQNFGHHDGMLSSIFPKEKVLLEADGYNPQAATATPPNPPSPFTTSLLDNIAASEARRAADRARALSGRQPGGDDGGADEVGRTNDVQPVGFWHNPLASVAERSGPWDRLNGAGA